MISPARLEKALTYLAETDEVCASHKAEVARSEYMAKVADAMAFKLAEGNNEERKVEARLAQPVIEAWEKHFKAVQAYETIRAKREREILIVDVWRSLNANRRTGQVQ